MHTPPMNPHLAHKAKLGGMCMALKAQFMVVQSDKHPQRVVGGVLRRTTTTLRCQHYNMLCVHSGTHKSAKLALCRCLYICVHTADARDKTSFISRCHVVDSMVWNAQTD
jgi:hypothetical protein